MKNCLKIAIATAIAALVTPVCGMSDVSMCAGQSMDIGAITVTNDTDNLYVSFDIIESGWYLTETHVAVGDDIPVTSKGNPIPGHFPYACELDGSLQSECEVIIPLDELSGEVRIAAHAAVFQLAGDGCGIDLQYASEVITNNQGTAKDPIKYPNVPAANRSVESSMFQGGEYPPGVPENLGFFSLGFGGDVTVEFGDGYPVYNAPGIDLCIQEITNGRADYALEVAELYGVNDTEIFIAEVTSKDTDNGHVCVDLPADVETVDFVKIDDNTDPTPHRDDADAYDVDFIAACYLYMGEETAWGAACYEDEGKRFVEKGNWGTYFNYTIVTAPDGCALSANDGHVYLTCQGQKTVPESETFCAAEGMELAYIDDFEENTFVVDTALAEFGYVDFEDTSYWIANTKSDSPIFPWATGEPNNVSDQCIHILRYGNQPYGWNDAGCTDWTWGWVCESAD